MYFPVKFRYFLLLFALPFVFYNATAQAISEKNYQHTMRLLDSLSFYKIGSYDSLYRVSVFFNRGRGYTFDYYGWIDNLSDENIRLIATNGSERKLRKKEIIKITPVLINDLTIDTVLKKAAADGEFHITSFGENHLLNLWFYKKGKDDYSKKVLQKDDTLFSDNYLRDDFGTLYYDAMLSAFSVERNYPKAIEFGSHLSAGIFKGYRYQNDAIALTRQLRSNTEDFKAFHNPDSLEWSALKQKLRRNEQILYLADRLRLINCVQSGQPAFISYDEVQFSVSCAGAEDMGFSYWEPNNKYNVINPYVELFRMQLSPMEIKLLLPYLLSEAYIPTYTYFRDFMRGRTVHKLSWVVNSLIFEITGKRFFEEEYFNSLLPDQKKAEVEKIIKWCDENAAFSHQELAIKIAETTDLWSEFYKALRDAEQGKYLSILSIIVKRFNDFNGVNWPSDKGVMAKTMYDLGNEKYVTEVRKWNKDKSDEWVNLWSSLFLLKYDKDNYNQAMTALESVLKKCDGTTYYPHAMDFLLSMNDKRALKLAEGILDKERFHTLIYWDYYLNFIKKLLLLKSDYTFNLIDKHLAAFTPEETKSLTENNGGMNMLTEGDQYVLAVEKLRNRGVGYDTESGIPARLAYKKQLGKWFEEQYDLLKKGKPNQLQLKLTLVNEPVTFVDSPR